MLLETTKLLTLHHKANSTENIRTGSQSILKDRAKFLKVYESINYKYNNIDLPYNSNINTIGNLIKEINKLKINNISNKLDHKYNKKLTMKYFLMKFRRHTHYFLK